MNEVGISYDRKPNSSYENRGWNPVPPQVLFFIATLHPFVIVTRKLRPNAASTIVVHDANTPCGGAIQSLISICQLEPSHCSMYKNKPNVSAPWSFVKSKYVCTN